MKKTILTMALLFASIVKMHGSANENRIRTISPDAFRGLNANRISTISRDAVQDLDTIHHLNINNNQEPETPMVSNEALSRFLYKWFGIGRDLDGPRADR